MTWEEVRKLYPNKFVKVEIIKSHTIDNKQYVDEVAVIAAIDDGYMAMKEFVREKGKYPIYSTENENFVMELRDNVGLRRIRGM